MKKQILTFCLIALTWSLSFATANYVYHEQTANNPGCGSNNYISSTSPTSSESVTIAFKVEYQNYTNQVRVYYTTDGSSPNGALGIGTGSTLVLVASFDCTFLSGQNVDVCSATIPALPSGTVVKYVVSAWHSGGGDEIFANSGEFSSPLTSALSATQYSYTVATPTPVTLSQFNAASRDNKVALN